MTKAPGVFETQGSAPEPGRRLCSLRGNKGSAEEQRLAGQFRPPGRRAGDSGSAAAKLGALLAFS